MKKKFVYLLILVPILIGAGWAIDYFLIQKGSQNNNNNNNQNTIYPYQKILLNRFPIDLDLLYWMDNLTVQQSRLNYIKTGSAEATSNFIVPYPNFFHTAHNPACMKWYLYCSRSLPVSLPVDSYLIIHPYGNSNITSAVNETAVLYDIHIALYLSYYIYVDLDHISVLKNFSDTFFASTPINVFNYTTSQAVFIKANTTFGYTENVSAMDFAIGDTHEPNFPVESNYNLQNIDTWKNPLGYFTDSMQTTILAHWNIEHEAMTISGLYPEGSLNQTVNINENKTLFGIWYYANGSLILNNNSHQLGWYSFDGSTLCILNVNRTDNTTFWKDQNTGLPFNSSMVGVFWDGICNPIVNYPHVGLCYMYANEGTMSSGIAQLTPFGLNDRGQPLYMKYQISNTGSTWYNETLTLDYYNSLSAAQSGFTSNQSVYVRVPQHQ
jgi:hypothetical protein